MDNSASVVVLRYGSAEAKAQALGRSAAEMIIRVSADVVEHLRGTVARKRASPAFAPRSCRADACPVSSGVVSSSSCNSSLVTFLATRTSFTTTARKTRSRRKRSVQLANPKHVACAAARRPWTHGGRQPRQELCHRTDSRRQMAQGRRASLFGMGVCDLREPACLAVHVPRHIGVLQKRLPRPLRRSGCTQRAITAGMAKDKAMLRSRAGQRFAHDNMMCVLLLPLLVLGRRAMRKRHRPPLGKLGRLHRRRPVSRRKYDLPVY